MVVWHTHTHTQRDNKSIWSCYIDSMDIVTKLIHFSTYLYFFLQHRRIGPSSQIHHSSMIATYARYKYVPIRNPSGHCFSSSAQSKVWIQHIPLNLSMAYLIKAKLTAYANSLGKYGTYSFVKIYADGTKRKIGTKKPKLTRKLGSNLIMPNKLSTRIT